MYVLVRTMMESRPKNAAYEYKYDYTYTGDIIYHWHQKATALLTYTNEVCQLNKLDRLWDKTRTVQLPI